MNRTVTLTREEAAAVERALERYAEHLRKRLHPHWRPPAEFLPIRDAESALEKVRSA
jgi:hypothetical protein